MTEPLTFTAVYETVEGGWVSAHLAEIPGVITAAPSRAEAEDMLLDALREYLLSFTDTVSVDISGPVTDSSPVRVTFSTPAA